MDEHSQKKIALKLARKALKYIAECDAAPTPHAFEVFYTACSGLNPKLNEALQKCQAGNGTVSSEAAEQLYDTFIRRNSSQVEIAKVGSDMARAMSNVLAMLHGAGTQTSEFQTSLESAEVKLDSAEDGNQSSLTVKSVLAATKEMSRVNAELQENLAKSHKQVDQLTNCLKLVREEAAQDSLTAMVNRRKLDSVVDEALIWAREVNKPVSFLMLDVDNFKSFNEKHSHTAGDSALRYVASCIKCNIKGSDTAGRYGGDEFVVVLPDTDLEHAIAVAERIRHLVNSRNLIKKTTNESMGRVSLSIGAMVSDGSKTREQCYQEASECLIAAKQAGRNQVSSSCQPDPEIIADIA